MNLTFLRVFFRGVAVMGVVGSFCCVTGFVAGDVVTEPATEPALPFDVPVRADGLKDYVGALNEIASKGVTADNNAAVVLMPFIVSSLTSPELLSSYAKTLNLGEVKWQPIIGLDGYARKHRDGKDGSSDQEFDQRVTSADMRTEKIWREADAPVVAAWLHSNGPAMVAARAASRNDRFFYSPLLERKPIAGVLGGMMMLTAGEMRLSHLMVKQTFLDYGQGHADVGLENLLVVHRLARLYSQQPIFITQLAAAAQDRFASNVEIALIESGTLSPDNQSTMLHALSILHPFQTNPDTFRVGELLFNLDLVQQLHHGETNWTLGILAEFFTHMEFEHGDLDKCEWKRLEEMGIQSAMQWDAILKLPTYEARLKAVKATMGQPVGPTFSKPFLGAVSSNSIERTREVNTFLLKQSAESNLAYTDRIGQSIFLSNPEETARLLGLIDEAAVRASLVRVALALCLYHAAHGRYPDNLEALSPGLLPTVPSDWFSGKAFVYRPQKSGSILYSVGRDGVDDGGRDWDLKTQHGDLVIHLP